MRVGDVWLIGLTKETLGGLGRRWPPPCVQARLGRRGHTWTLRECWSRVGAGAGGGVPPCRSGEKTGTGSQCPASPLLLGRRWPAARSSADRARLSLSYTPNKTRWKTMVRAPCGFPTFPSILGDSRVWSEPESA